MNFPNHMNVIEQTICNYVITAAFDKGYTISVYDGMETVLKRSPDRALIQAETNATDITIYSVMKPYGSGEHGYMGNVVFIHGNHGDVIHDHTDNEFMEELLSTAMAYGEIAT